MAASVVRLHKLHIDKGQVAYAASKRGLEGAAATLALKGSTEEAQFERAVN